MKAVVYTGLIYELEAFLTDKRDCTNI